MCRDHHDAVEIGSGSNRLAAAITLADHGRSVDGVCGYATRLALRETRLRRFW